MSQQRVVRLGTTPFAGLDRLTGHLDHHVRRQQLLAANLANLDTPGYRARDLRFEESIHMARTDRGVQGTITHSDAVYVADDETPDQDGNSVSLETQLAKMTANNLRFQGLAELLSRRIGMLRFAATDGNR